MPDSPGILGWLFGSTPETPEAAAARKRKEDADKRAAGNIQQAIKGFGTLKKVVSDADAANAAAAKKKQ
jgi:hypothetical protein